MTNPTSSDPAIARTLDQAAKARPGDKDLAPTGAAREDAPIGWTTGSDDDGPLPPLDADGGAAARSGGGAAPAEAAKPAAGAGAAGILEPGAGPAPAQGDGAHEPTQSDVSSQGGGIATVALGPATTAPSLFRPISRPVAPAEGSSAAPSLDGVSTGGQPSGGRHAPGFAVADSGQPAAPVEHAPTVGGTHTGEVKEDAKLIVSGQLTAHDADPGDTHIFQLHGQPTGTFGSLTLDPATGAWSYALDNAKAQVLGEGHSFHERFTVWVTDQTGKSASQTITVTVAGTNDRPVIAQSSIVTGGVTEDDRAHVSATGTLAATDVDAGTQLTWSLSAAGGAYGTIAIDPQSGHWTYTLDNGRAATQALGADRTATEVFTATVTDEHGATATRQIVVTVTGTNDQPTLTVPAPVGVQEGGTVFHGQLSATDPDTGDALTFSMTGTVPGFTLHADGSYSFDPTDPAYDHLAAGKQEKLDIPVTVTDPHGGTDTRTLKIFVRGTDDCPVVSHSAITSGGATEDAARTTATGTLSATDVDTGAHLTWSIGTTAGTYGSIAVDPQTGAWTYTLDNSRAATQGLAKGQTEHETFTATVTDEHGQSATAQITVTVSGTNDAPVIGPTFTNSGGLTEDATRATATGMLTATDVDTGSQLTWSVATTAGTYGTLAIDPQTGAWTYTLDNSRAATQGLTAGQTGHETFAATVTDEHGATATRDITLTVTGTNDAPTITGQATGSVDEDQHVGAGGMLEASGQLHITDVDSGEAAFQAQAGVAGTYGTFSVDASGQWHYTADNAQQAIQDLNTGQHLTDTLTVTSVDGTAHTVTVTINGLDDHVTIGGDVTGGVKEDVAGSGTFLGTMTVTGGAHAADRGFGDHVLTGQYGSFDLRDDGRWIYTLDNTNPHVQALAEGETLKDTITVHAKDGTPQDLAVTVTGTHDLPVIAAHGAAADHAITAVTQIVAPTAAQDLSGFATQQTGVATGVHLVGLFMPGSDVNVLAGVPANELPSIHTGYTLQGVSGYSYLDGRDWFTSRVPGVDFTALPPSVKNTWDGGLAVFSDGTVVQVQKVCEGQAGTPEKDYIYYTPYQGLGAQGGTVVAGHATAGATVQVFSGGSLLGTATADAHGDWSLGVPKLADGDHALHTVVGGHASAAQVFTVAGATATEHPGALGLGSVTEAAATHSVSGVLDVTDVDATDNPVFTAQSGTAGTYGTFAIDAQGHWTYTLDNARAATLALPDGTRQTETFQVQVTTHSGEQVTQTVTVTVVGTDTAAVVSGDTTGAVREGDVGDTVTATGAIGVSDADAGHTPSFANATVAGTYGSIAVNAAGDQWTYTLDETRVQGLTEGRTVTDTLTVTDSEGNPQTIAVTITGTNDAPVLTAAPAAVDEGAAVLHGQLSATDPDTGDRLTYSSPTPVPGFAIAADGSYSFDPRLASFDSLADGVQQVVRIPVTVTDSHGASASQTLQITVTGTNDQPVMTVVPPQGATEGGAVVHGQLGATDPDTGDTLTYSTTATIAGFSLNADGSYSFDPGNAAYDHLAAGQPQVLHIPVTVSDGHGGTATQTLQITVTGTNDAPVVAGTSVNAGAVTEDAATTTVSGTMAATDVDDGAQHGWMLFSTIGSYGTMAIDPHTGTWTYTLDNSLAATQGLAAGQVEHETFTAVVTDEHGTSSPKPIIVTVTGSNEAPTVSAGTSDLGATPEDTARTFTEAEILHAVGATDPDGGTLHVTGISVDAAYGTFTKAAGGGWTFTPAANVHHDDIPLTVTVGDGSATAQAHGSLDVTPVTDAATPTLVVSARQQVMEFGPAGTGAVVSAAPVSAGGAMSGLSVEMTIIGGQQVATVGIHGATLISYATPSDSNAFYVWNPDNLTFRIGGHEYATGVPLPGDGLDHRLSFVWDGHTGTLDVLIDGQVAAHQNNVGRGTTLADGGKFALAQDQDSFGGGFETKDAFKGKMFSVAIAKTAVAPDQLATAPLSAVLKGSPNLLTDIHVDHGHVVDATGYSTYTTQGDMRYPTVDVDTAIAPPVPGATIHLDASVAVPADRDDTVASVIVTGLPPGTVLTDSHHSVTISAASPTVDVNGWALDSLSAQLPSGFAANARIGLTVVTQGPDGTQAQASTSEAIVFNPLQPVPNAVIGGDDAKTTDEDTAVGGTLTVTDADAGQAGFAAQIDSNGQYGKFSVDAQGHWTYTPDDRADALAAGATAKEAFTVTSADGTTHSVAITLTGTDDAAVVSGATTGAVREGDTGDTVMATGAIGVTDPDTTTSFAGATATGQYGTIAVNAAGDTWTYTLDETKVQGLADRATVTDTLTLTDSTGNTQTITLTVTGTNDRPVVAGTSVAAGTVTEDAATTTATGTLAATDVDAGAQLTWSLDTTAGTYGTIALDPATGHWTYTLGNSRAATQALAAGQAGHETFTATVTDEHGATATTQVTVTVTGTNTGPTVNAGMADLGATHEDTARSFTEAELLHAVGATDADGDTLHVTAISVDAAYGSFAKQVDGSWTFTPAANAHHDDIPITISVGDGAVTTDADALIQLQSVTDPARAAITMTAEQEIITTGPADQLGRIQVDRLATPPLTAFTLEFTVIGKAVPDTGAGQGPVVVNIGHPGDNNMLSLWNPGNMKIGGAGNVATNINLGDGNSHRITLTWDSASGDLKVFDNGALASTVHDWHKGAPLPADLYMVVGGKVNDLAQMGGFRASEHYEGDVFNVALADKALDAAEVGLGMLASQVDKTSGLLIDVRSVHGSLMDATGHHTLTDHGGIGDRTAQVDTAIAVPPPGSLIHLDIDAAATAADDRVTGVTVHGFLAGTVLGDGTHSHTVTGPGEAVDVTSWDLDHVTVRLPPGVSMNMAVGLEVETTGPDGATALTQIAEPLVLNPAQPVPDAVIGGDDAKATDEDTAVSGSLTITDADAGEAVFAAQTDTDGQYGKFSIDEHGHWTYTPDDRADALADGATAHETFTVASADGSTHQVLVNLTGTDDALPSPPPPTGGDAADSPADHAAVQWNQPDALPGHAEDTPSGSASLYGDDGHPGLSPDHLPPPDTAAPLGGDYAQFAQAAAAGESGPGHLAPEIADYLHLAGVSAAEIGNHLNLGTDGADPTAIDPGLIDADAHHGDVPAPDMGDAHVPVDLPEPPPPDDNHHS